MKRTLEHSHNRYMLNHIEESPCSHKLRCL